ncbi:hypothetical protein TSAR_013150 [Trichomalopsis sarcophagae]|uniref:Uncharacterized protein n=1 Tax=Trichomalopsis sarcophagae TaxID=543379 RepID=A0A232FI18_9HYME|nr:hypothetical protein TSAR_013150 [Trichomalopsis sarcophagae]
MQLTDLSNRRVLHVQYSKYTTVYCPSARTRPEIAERYNRYMCVFYIRFNLYNVTFCLKTEKYIYIYICISWIQANL